MAGAFSCLVCTQSLDGTTCVNCGACQTKVREAIEATEPASLPTWRQMFWHRKELVEPLSEAIWADLSPSFKEPLLRNYETQQRSARSVSTLAIFPVIVALFGSCYWSGVVISRWLGLGGGLLGEWICGVSAIPLLLAFRVLPIGGRVERWLLLQSQREIATRAVLDQLPLISMAVLRRCQLPWYLKPEILCPFAIVIVSIAGLLLL